MAGIKPDRADSGIDAALDIRGQAVPDDYCCFFMEIRDSGEAAVKVFPARKALCDAIGVDCRYVHANAKASNPSHQWNQVKVGGKWYILDAQSNGFLLGTNTWIKQAGMSWDTKGLPTCSKTDYKR